MSMLSSTLPFARVLLSLLVATCAAFLFTQTVSAHEDHLHIAEAEVGVSATVETTGGITLPPPPPVRPRPEPMPIRGDASLREQLQAKQERTTSELREKRLETRDDIAERLEERREALQENRGERVEDRRDAMKSRLTERAAKMFRLVLARLNAAVDRLENIASRIDSRIEKLEDRGLDMAETKALQVTAKAKIAEAQVAVNAIVAPVLPVGASTTPQQVNDALKVTRDAAKKAEEAILAARMALRDVVKELKASDDTQVEANASTTVSGSAN